jgi:phage baseplate assembly protein W
MPHLDFPYRIDNLGRSAQTLDDGHLRDLIEQVLFTAPGERVMRPDFGCGLAQLVFEPNSSTLAATTQMLVQAGMQKMAA